VIKTVIRDSDNTRWPVLTKTNYAEWSSMMRVKLEARQMWTVVRLSGVSRQEDRRAPRRSVPRSRQRCCRPSPGTVTLKDTWDAIAAARVVSDCARKSALQKLREEWDFLAFKPGEEVDDFALRLSSLRQRLEQYDNYEITKERAVAKFLRWSPKKYLQLKIAIQTMIDILTLTIEELTGRFKAVDDEEMAGESFPGGGKVYYATEHCQCHVSTSAGRRRSLQTGASVGSHARCPRRLVALRAMHEVSRRPTLRRAMTTMATSATIVAGVATLLGSATSRGGAGLATDRGTVRPTTDQGAAKPSPRRSWKKTRRWLCSRNTAPESGSRINVFVII
jgi:hypothetical protein